MAVTKKDLAEHRTAVFLRQLTLTFLLADLLEVQLNSELEWDETLGHLKESFDSLLEEPITQKARERVPQIFAIVACLAECAEWSDVFTGPQAPKIADLDLPFADLLKLDEECRAFIRRQDPEFQKLLFDFKPFELTKTGRALWFARQHRLLRNAKIPWVQIRALRGEQFGLESTRHEVSKRGTSLMSRIAKKDGELLFTDCLLDVEQVDTLVDLGLCAWDDGA